MGQPSFINLAVVVSSTLIIQRHGVKHNRHTHAQKSFGRDQKFSSFTFCFRTFSRFRFLLHLRRLPQADTPASSWHSLAPDFSSDAHPTVAGLLFSLGGDFGSSADLFDSLEGNRPRNRLKKSWKTSHETETSQSEPA